MEMPWQDDAIDGSWTRIMPHATCSKRVLDLIEMFRVPSMRAGGALRTGANGFKASWRDTTQFRDEEIAFQIVEIMFAAMQEIFLWQEKIFCMEKYAT